MQFTIYDQIITTSEQTTDFFLPVSTNMLRHSRISKIDRLQLFEMFQSEKMNWDLVCSDDCLDDENISL